jgi:hypothetical protein
MSPSSYIKLLCPLLLSGLGACASQPAAVSAPVQQVAEAAHEPFCLRDTGSRLQPPPGRCLPDAGRVLLLEDLQRTGEISVSGAVRKLIP